MPEEKYNDFAVLWMYRTTFLSLSVHVPWNRGMLRQSDQLTDGLINLRHPCLRNILFCNCIIPP